MTTPDLTTPDLALRRIAGDPAGPGLVLGPSLGTAVEELWADVARRVRDEFTVYGWDLPGHGAAPRPSAPYTVAQLAGALAAGLVERGTGPVHVAGDSLGGAVTLQLALDRPDLVATAIVCCTGARIGDERTWRERAELVSHGGTGAVVDGSRQRWFGNGFVDREPQVAQRLLDTLRGVDDEGYIAACEALAGFDVRDRLGELAPPLLAVAGADDVVTPAAGLRHIADSVQDGRLDVLPGVAHLAPAEAPEQVAALILGHAARGRTVSGVRAAGGLVRRQVLGDAHVDRSVEATTELTGDFQDFITQYAWGSVWTRPVLTRRERSLITLTALTAHGHHDELALHVRAALRNGVTRQEISETLLHAAIYVGVPAANAAFRVAQRVLDEQDDAG